MPKESKQPISMDCINKLRECVGTEMTYKQICQIADLPIQYGNSKAAQMKELQKYCELEKVDGTHRYLIKQMYDTAAVELADYLDAPEQQLLFDAALYQEFLKNDGQPLYLSNTEMILLFKEVNENFLYTFNKKALYAINHNFTYMADMSKVVYRILHQWTHRRIENISKRRIVLCRPGFRLYSTIDNDGVKCTISKNVEPGSDIEKRCQVIWDAAMKEIRGVEYIGSTSRSTWLPEEKWLQFEKKVAELTKAEFSNDGDYDNLRGISILECPSTQWLQSSLDYISRVVGSTLLINTKAKKKILATRQLDAICTNTQRQEFIDYNMTQTPPRWFNNR